MVPENIDMEVFLPKSLDLSIHAFPSILLWSESSSLCDGPSLIRSSGLSVLVTTVFSMSYSDSEITLIGST